jgi:hypothetical protein
MKYLKKSFSVGMTSKGEWPKCGEAKYENGERIDCVLDMGHKERGQGGCLFPKMPRDK